MKATGPSGNAFKNETSNKGVGSVISPAESDGHSAPESGTVVAALARARRHLPNVCLPPALHKKDLLLLTDTVFHRTTFKTVKNT